MLQLYDLLGFQSEPGKPNTVETPDNSTMHRLSARRSHWSYLKKKAEAKHILEHDCACPPRTFPARRFRTVRDGM